MADEYIARIPGGAVPSLNTVARQLCDDGLCALESSPDGAVHLRWAGKPRREDWPEDITLSVLRDGVLLTIHSGTGDQLAGLIEQARGILAGMTGLPVSFEEA